MNWFDFGKISNFRTPKDIFDQVRDPDFPRPEDPPQEEPGDGEGIGPTGPFSGDFPRPPLPDIGGGGFFGSRGQGQSRKQMNLTSGSNRSSILTS